MLKTLLVLLALTVCVIVAAKTDSEEKYDNFCAKHKKDNTKLSKVDRDRRKGNYMRNKKFYDDFNNNPKHTFKLGSNENSDRDPDTFKSEVCRTELPAEARSLPVAPGIYPLTNPAPAFVNWTSYALPVVHQLQCGSCWAFSSVATLELYNAIRGRPTPPLSQQNVVDCDTTNGACGGGWPRKAFEFLKNSYGNKLSTSASYPYTSGTTKLRGTCKPLTTSIPLNFNTIYQYDLNGDENKLKSIVANLGPTTIAMQVQNATLFSGYKTGIFLDPSCPVSNSTFNQCSVVNHGMVVVGYGTEGVQDYWLVRNSWGVTWGTNGYIKMPRNKKNHCNVACFAMGVE